MCAGVYHQQFQVAWFWGLLRDYFRFLAMESGNHKTRYGMEGIASEINRVILAGMERIVTKIHGVKSGMEGIVSGTNGAKSGMERIVSGINEARSGMEIIMSEINGE